MFKKWFSISIFDVGEFIRCRVAETRLLLFEIAYKKAKLHLMGVKRNILLVLYSSHVFSFL
jgi:hypothetical protein